MKERKGGSEWVGGWVWGEGDVRADICHEVLLKRQVNHFALKKNSREPSTVPSSCLFS